MLTKEASFELLAFTEGAQTAYSLHIHLISPHRPTILHDCEKLHQGLVVIELLTATSSPYTFLVP